MGRLFVMISALDLDPVMRRSTKEDGPGPFAPVKHEDTPILLSESWWQDGPDSMGNFRIPMFARLGVTAQAPL